MANFVLIIDPQTERRTKFLTAAEDRIAPLPGLQVESCACGSFGSVSARAPNTPFSRSVHDDSVAWLFGTALGQEPDVIHARNLRSLWPHHVADSGTFDGYYAGFVYDDHEGLTVSCDILGMFPLY